MKKTELTEYTVETEKFSEGFSGFKFALLSDLHSNCYKTDLHGLNRAIRAEMPDAVLIAGDMFNAHIKDKPQEVIAYLSALAGHYPVFFALGNHEYRMKIYTDIFGERYYDIRERLTKAGVVFLEDETVTLEKENERLMLSGLEIDMCFYKKTGGPKMGGGLADKHLGVPDTRFYNLLLAHNPDYFHRYAKWGADLTLAGHLHGGIVRIPRVGGVVSTTGFILPKYDSGMYYYKNSLMLVSRGLGAHTLPIRINNRPELVMLKILAKNGL
ncbi:MAG: metallophosphoesterase [Butyrivibrio sp.]|nr:metallophosphoesterase [Butyrivibrio sp.]